jgi:GNAT superfamily N-acetyltransferase
MDASLTIRRLGADEARAAASALGEVLLDCVRGGASVSFMADMTRDEAEAFWLGVAEVIPAGPPNQPHRADIAKMLVHRRARRRGVGEALMRAAEDAARAMGKTLLTLDTVTGGVAERLYARLGWVRVGSIPNYALMPDGEPCATTVFYKALAQDPPLLGEVARRAGGG